MTEQGRELQRAQAELLPGEDLKPFEGQWVALRGGRVVAHDLDPVALRERPGVAERDMLLPVPAATAGVYIL